MKRALRDPRVLVGEPLELDRILDVALLLGRERERRPVLAGLARVLEVVVVGDLDLDHPHDLAGSRPASRAPSSIAAFSSS